MPPWQRFLGGLGVPAVLLLLGLAQGGFFGGQRHTLGLPITMGLLGAGIVVLFFGRTVVLKSEGIGYGYFFVTGRPIPWARITDIAVDSKIAVRGGGQSWHLDLHLESGGALRLPAPYAVGKEPSVAFAADYEAIRQRWHQERTHTKSLARHPRHKD